MADKSGSSFECQSSFTFNITLLSEGMYIFSIAVHLSISVAIEVFTCIGV